MLLQPDVPAIPGDAIFVRILDRIVGVVINDVVVRPVVRPTG
jgi:hypothetical protein